jgi:hypothetical protein
VLGNPVKYLKSLVETFLQLHPPGSISSKRFQAFSMMEAHHGMESQDIDQDPRYAGNIQAMLDEPTSYRQSLLPGSRYHYNQKDIIKKMIALTRCPF